MVDFMDISSINGYSNIESKIIDAKTKAAGDGFEKSLNAAMDTKDKEELKKACREFEGIFLNFLYRQMKATVPKSGLIPGDVGRDIFESMLDDKLMETASESRSLGLADMLYKQLDKQLSRQFKPGDAEK